MCQNIGADKIKFHKSKYSHKITLIRKVCEFQKIGYTEGGGTPQKFRQRDKIVIHLSKVSSLRQNCNSHHKFGNQNSRYSGKLQFSRTRAFANLIIDVVKILYSVFIMAYRSLLPEAIIFSITTKISIN